MLELDHDPDKGANVSVRLPQSRLYIKCVCILRPAYQRHRTIRRSLACGSGDRPDRGKAGAAAQEHDPSDVIAPKKGMAKRTLDRHFAADLDIIAKLGRDHPPRTCLM